MTFFPPQLPDGPAQRARTVRLPRLPRTAALALAMMAACEVHAGDILRGGTSLSAAPGKAGPIVGNVAAEVARVNARDALTRTTQSMNAVNAMEAAARAAAVKGPNHLGFNPNKIGTTLPNVPDGLVAGGLQVGVAVPKNLASVQPGEAARTWIGAQLPKQNAAGGRTVVTVQQTKQQALLTWQTFNVGKNTTVKFDQSAGGETRSQWIAVNKIKDPSGAPSQILGNLEADGQVYLINPNGILFGGSSQINLHTLIASSLPVNDGLLTRGVLNNPDGQFLFSALPIDAGAKGTPAFTPDAPSTDNAQFGDVIVQAGATISSPTSGANVGGRVVLLAPTVRNEGTISVPDGQAILAAGLQVGLTAHASSNPGVRGLDVFVGEVKYPSDAPACRNGEIIVTGTATNSGLILAPRANVTIAGRSVNQLGVISSTTSVTLNGSVTLLAQYGARAIRPDPANDAEFTASANGGVEIGAASAIEILPELASARTVTGTRLPLRSQIIIEGRAIHFGENSTVLAPNADVTIRAGTRLTLGASGYATVFSAGQIYLDANALLNVAGTTDVVVPISQNILSLELRGAELADSPLQRTGPLRATTLNLDIRQSGLYAGREWVGTPLGDARGFVGLIERGVGELTTAGGTVKMTAGNSVVMQGGSKIDVSGGWVQFEGGTVQTTRVVSGGQILDIAQATPDRVFDGLYDGTFTITHPKYALSETFANPLQLSNERFEEGYLAGKNGGTIAITAPAMALDGALLGQTLAGARQRTPQTMATASTLALTFEAADANIRNFPDFSPTPPAIVFQTGAVLPKAAAFSAKSPVLELARLKEIILSPDIFATSGFGSISLGNPDGDVEIAAGTKLRAPERGALKITAANLNVQGSVVAPGGSLNFTVYQFTPYDAHTFPGTAPTIPKIDPTRGFFTLGAAASLDVAGLVVDDRPLSAAPLTQPLVLDGGSVSIASFSADLQPGSAIDASGGAAFSTTGKRTFGNGGTISLKAGQDPAFSAVLGGRLRLGARLTALSGAKAGALTILAPSIQIGGTTANKNTLLLAPEFFSEGGFGSFTLTGIGQVISHNVEDSLPGIRVVADTVLRPIAKSRDVVPYGPDGNGLQIIETTLPAGQRSPVSISLTATGARDGNETLVRGKVILEKGARLETDPKATLAVSGEYVTVNATLLAPGGTISISGLSDSTRIEGGTQTSLTTVHLGGDTVLSTAGATLLTPNAFGFRTGAVLAGGRISVSGNIVAEAGALLDVSGASDTLDLPTASVAMGSTLSARSGLTTPLYTPTFAPMRLDSDGGEIVLAGGDHLFSDATLRGAAGGASALGGALTVSSGRFYRLTRGDDKDPLKVTLQVTQSGATLPQNLVTKSGTSVGLAVRGEGGAALDGYGRFAVDRFTAGGFDTLTLKGTVAFQKAVTIAARGSLTVADGGVLYGNGAILLSAPYVKLGTRFLAPLAPEQIRPPFFSGASGNTVFPFDATFGPGKLTVIAKLIDVGNLSLQGIGEANFLAEGGEVRGDGTLDVAGQIRIRAGQVYPPSAVTFTIAASDYTSGGQLHAGSIVVENGGARQLPWSAGGQLNLYASTIVQGGTLRAPLGGITLGWDGTGPAPRDPISGENFAVAQVVTLAPGSLTSVSGVDPRDGSEMLVPYGLNLNGVQWIDPTGRDITAGGVVQKTIRIAGAEVRSEAGSTVDIRGGGDLFSFRFVPGIGGSMDVLSTTTSFAVVPDYAADFVPYAPFNPVPLAEGSALKGTVGYVNETLRVGDRIFLGASEGLAEGFYTLLPARYALLPGGHLVTPAGTTTPGVVEKPDGTAVVPGFRFNDLNTTRTLRSPLTAFEVLGPADLRARSEFKEYSANEFLLTRAKALETKVPRLPADAGHLTLQARNAMTLHGDVTARGAGAANRGGLVDIASTSDIVINAGGGEAAGRLVLDAARLNSFGAESLLIGGTREVGSVNTTISVKTANITVDNAGVPLSGPEIILAANEILRVAPGAVIQQTGSIVGEKGETLRLSGDGTLLRVTSDPTASLVRTGLAGSQTANMIVEGGALISGAGITLDSTYGTALDPNAILTGSSIALNSGQISILLNHDCVLHSDGLILSGAVLDRLASSQQLSLLSYSTIDLFGTGTFTASGSLALHAAQIRGRGDEGRSVTIAARTLLLDNAANAAVIDTPADPDGTLTFRADTITLGRNQLAIESYTTVELSTARGLTLSGTGGLGVQKNLTAHTPFLTAAQSATQSIKAGGTFDLLTFSGATATTSGGLGASVTIEGAMVTVSSDIVLPSGALTLHSTTCDVTVNGRLDLNGTERQYYDLIRRTPGGQISLISDSGSVKLGASSVISVSAPAAGGDAGALRIIAPNGAFDSAGRFSGRAGPGGLAGSFALDAGSLDEFAPLETALAEGGFTQAQTFRIHLGDVELSGNVAAHEFRLSADQGSISVRGTIDSSGVRGGVISLVAAGGVTLLDTARLTVAAETFDAAGKGGAISLEARGLEGGTIEVRAGSRIDLSVAGATPASAGEGQFTGTLHLRAPQNLAGTDLAVAPLAGTIVGASSIVVEGYQTFDLTATGGLITADVQSAVLANGNAFLGAGSAAMLTRILGTNTALDAVLSIRPGAELVNTAGDLTLGSAGSTYTSDWNLATFRFGAEKAPGVLTLRAAGNIVLFNSISDGFADGKYTAVLLQPNAALPLNAQSWSYRFTAGADFTAADGTRVAPLAGLGETSGSLLLGKNGNSNVAPAPGPAATTVAAIGNKYQTIRTGSGDIEINAARDVQLLNPFATIFTAGTLIADPTKLRGDAGFDLPIRFVNRLVDNLLGVPQQEPYYAVQYTLGGGNVSINAGADIAHYTRNSTGQRVADSERQLPINWLYRRGNIDPVTGQFGIGLNGDVTSTTWWVDFANFFEGVGALGGGNVTLNAGRDVANVDAVAPTNGRMAKGVPDAGTLVELGGGDVTVRSGRDIDGGVYYVERGSGTLAAGGEIKTNSTRSPSVGVVRSEADVLDAHTWLPTTLFAGKASFEISARGDLLLGPVVNPFLLPGGYNNAYYYKTYFSTYAETNEINLTSLSGDVTLRNAVTLSGNGDATPTLLAWFQNELLITGTSRAQPWLRLNETRVEPFKIAMTVLPSTLRATALAGDINVTGTLNLAPSANGTAELIASGAINGLNITGITQDNSGATVTAWSAGQINVSDASPASVPGIASPLGYQALFGTEFFTAQTNDRFFAGVDAIFAESGSTRALLQQKQALHAAGLLHGQDAAPLRLYAASGDISGLTVFSPKAARIFAGHDISDIAFYAQNTRATDISVVSAGRDITAYAANSPLRTLAAEPGNIVSTSSIPLAGDLQISGPGTLEVFAGRDLDLGVGPAGNGIALGVVSIGNARNPFLPFGGADIVAGAGIGPATGLESSPLDLTTFLTDFLKEEGNRERYAGEIARLGGTDGKFTSLTSAQRSLAALELFYLALRDAGRDHSDENRAGFQNYDAGFAAIEAVLGAGKFQGNISLTAREFKTQSGGNISLLAPGGKVIVGLDVAETQALDQGILTESGGSIFIFADDSVSLGTSRIFTLRGGNEIIWSSQGDIAAGVASKTVQSAPPTRVLIDPQSGDLKTDLAGLATGGGIGVLATVEGIPPGDVDLVAPNGAIDAGDAGIRSAGNLNIAATQVLNAENIQVSGNSVGTPTAAPVAAPNLGSISAANSTAGAASTAADNAAKQATQQGTQPQAAEEPASIISVEVLGYGGGEGG